MMIGINNTNLIRFDAIALHRIFIFKIFISTEVPSQKD